MFRGKIPRVPGAAVKNTCPTEYMVLVGFSYRIFESQGPRKASAPVCRAQGKGQVAPTQPQAGHTAPDEASPATVHAPALLLPWWTSPSPCPGPAPCGGYLSHASATELSMTKPAHSRDKGLGDGPRA